MYIYIYIIICCPSVQATYLRVRLVLRDVKQQSVLPLTVQSDVNGVHVIQEGVHAENTSWACCQFRQQRIAGAKEDKFHRPREFNTLDWHQTYNRGHNLQQRPDMLTITLKWHASKHGVKKTHWEDTRGRISLVGGWGDWFVNWLVDYFFFFFSSVSGFCMWA